MRDKLAVARMAFRGLSWRIKGTRALGIRNIRMASSVQVGRQCLLDAESFGGGTIEIGHRCQLHDFVQLATYGGSIRIGDDCSINPFSVIYGHGGLRIGNKVRIATGCIIIPANHTFVDPNLPIIHQPETRRGIVIEDDVWIAARVTILDGVTIGTGAVIAAGSVVSREVAPRTLVAGIPARFMKAR